MRKNISRYLVPVFLFAVIPGLLLTQGCGQPFPSSLNGADFPPDQMAEEVLRLTNRERAKFNLPPLSWNRTLAQAAEVHARDMAERDYFAHESLEGFNVGDRATDVGYDWMMVGENLAMGYMNPESVVRGWMDSPDHRANIVRTEFTELGVGIWTAANGQIYWVQVFGTPVPTSWLLSSILSLDALDEGEW